MDIGSLLLALALTLLVAAFVARPVLERTARRHRSPPDALPPADDLIAQREAILIELRDLDFDHTTGKMSEADYAAQRARLVAKGTAILRTLDLSQPTPAAAPDNTLETEIERLVAIQRNAARTTRRQPGAGLAQKPARGATTAKLSDNHCPNCKQPFEPGDKFCARCGSPLSIAEAAR